MKQSTLIAAAFLLTVITTGCNTIEGIGADIRQGGQAIQKAASTNK